MAKIFNFPWGGSKSAEGRQTWTIPDLKQQIRQDAYVLHAGQFGEPDETSASVDRTVATTLRFHIRELENLTGRSFTADSLADYLKD